MWRRGHSRRRECAWRTHGSGFSLVEVITAMALIAIVMMLLARLALSVGERGTRNDLTARRNLALAQQANRLQTLPLADIAALTSGTTQMLVGDFSFNRRLTVTSPASNRYTIKVVIAPIAGEFMPDSVTFDRSRLASGTPLCTGC